MGSTGARPDTHLGQFDVVVCRFFTPQGSSTIVVIPSQRLPNAAGVKLGRITDPASIPAPCPDEGLRFTADASGTCHITLTGSVNPVQQLAGVAPAVSIYADGVWFGDVPVVCYDLDGVSGLGAGDLSLWLSLFSSGEAWLLADYDGDGSLGARDLSLWLDAFDGGGQTESAALLCP